MKNGFSVWIVIVALALSACQAIPSPEPPSLTQRAIAVQITKEHCPSIEVEPNTYISWTNADNVDRMLIIERFDENGVLVESGGMPLLQPGTTFSMMMTEMGQYTYYCSLDREQFGTINVVPNTVVTEGASPEASTGSNGTPECAETLMPALITGIQPAQPTAGDEITVTGNGGFIQDSCGGVNESARSFALYLDHEPAGDFMCYVNHCELKVRLPDALTEGSHCLSTQKDACEFEFSVVKQ